MFEVRDLASLGSEQLLTQLRDLSAASSRLYAAQAAVMVEIEARCQAEGAGDFANSEIGATLHVSDRTAEQRLCTAQQLAGHPQLADRLVAGALGVGHALALIAETDHLPAEVAAAVQAHALADPERTPAQLRRVARRALLREHPELAREVAETARAEQAAWVHDTRDGMATLSARGPVELVALAMAAVRVLTPDRSAVDSRPRRPAGRHRVRHPQPRGHR